MDIDGYLFHLKARNLAPSTIKAAGEFLRPFERVNDPLNATKIEIQNYLGVMFDRCKPSTVWTAWRHLKGFYAWLETEGDIEINPTRWSTNDYAKYLEQMKIWSDCLDLENDQLEALIFEDERRRKSENSFN